MDIINYRISNKQVFEQAQVRSISDVILSEEELKNGMKLAVSKEDKSLELYLVEKDDKKMFEVRWDDSEELFVGWYSAWENFTWCLSIVEKEAVEEEPVEEESVEEEPVEVEENSSTI